MSAKFCLLLLFIFMVGGVNGQLCENGFTYYNAIGKCLRGFGRSLLWIDAEYVCSLFGGHLVSISNAFQNSQILGIAQHLSSNGKVSIGLTSQDGDSYHWTDGTPFNYQRWGPGEPDVQKHCAYIDPRNGYWISTACDDDLAFICETYPKPTGTTPTSCSATGCQKLDVLFAIHEWEDILLENFRKMINFVLGIAKMYTFCDADTGDISPCTKMGAIKFGDVAEEIITFNEATSYDAFFDKVNSTSYNEGITNTSSALYMAQTFFTNSTYGSRFNVPHVLILIAGKRHSEGTQDPVVEAVKLRTQYGVTIISIGVNGTDYGYSSSDTQELDNISGDPNLVFPGVNVNSLNIAFIQKVTRLLLSLFPCPPVRE